jgi:hypothetical protein
MPLALVQRLVVRHRHELEDIAVKVATHPLGRSVTHEHGTLVPAGIEEEAEDSALLGLASYLKA